MNNHRLVPEKAKLKQQITKLEKAEKTIEKELKECRDVAEEYGDKNKLTTIAALVELKDELKKTLQSLLLSDYMES